MHRMESHNNEPGEVNRRNFIKGGSFATLMTMLGGVELFAQPAEEPPAEGTPAGPKLKCAIVGLGPWGREILDELGRLPQVEIAAICDTYAPMVRRSSTKAPNAAQTEDYQTILDNKGIKAVIIATGTHQHKDIAVAALQAGKHVYCEAPLAITMEDARAIALAAKNSPRLVFQAGLQLRSDPQRHFLLPFIRSGALGKPVMARAQWHKKTSWRAASSSSEREKAINWRLNSGTSLGLVGEIGIHQFDQAGWLFLDNAPVALTGRGANLVWKDGRDVADTVQLLVEFPGGVQQIYDSTLGNSFDAEYEMFYGSYAAVMIRERKAWMFKEVDSPLLGWEVYASKDVFYKESGIALVADASKQTASGDKPIETPHPMSALYYALEAFVNNCTDFSAGVEDFASMFDVNDKAALANYLATLKLKPAAGYQEGYAATVLAIKANEAVTKGERIELKKDWFELT
jgi:predicted dehydrogenase